MSSRRYRKLRKLLSDPILFYRDSGFVRKLRLRNVRKKATSNSIDPKSMNTLIECIASEIAVVEYGAGEQHCIGVLLSDQEAFLFVLKNAAATKSEILLLHEGTEYRLNQNIRVPEFVVGRDVWQLKLIVDGKVEQLHIDFWKEVSNGFNCPNLSAVVSKIHKPSPAFRLAGKSFDLSQLTRCPPIEDIHFPVDLVFTWVDHEDPQWKKLFAKHGNTKGAKHKSLFANHDELRYAIRSVARYADWVETLFIVSNCAPPSWLDLEHPRISWIEHHEILDAAYLPTFNSHVIESAIHRIPGISEHFLYANDDMLFVNSVFKKDFFDSNGISKFFMEAGGTVNGQVSESSPGYLNAARNGQRLIEKDYGVSPTRLHKHVPYALKKSTSLKLEQKYHLEVGNTRKNRFRSTTDISVPSFFYHYYAFLVREAIPAQIDSMYISKEDSVDVTVFVNTKINSGCKVMCINDSIAGSLEASKWDRKIEALLNRLFPSKSEFEK